MIWRMVDDTNTLYLFHNGKLIYKKWLSTGQSRVFGLHGLVYGRGTVF